MGFAKTALKVGNELPNSREEELVNPAREYGRIATRLQIPLHLVARIKANDILGVYAKLGMRLIQTRTTVKQSDDNAEGLEMDQSDLDILKRAYNRDMTKTAYRIAPSLEIGLMNDINAATTIAIGYSYTKYKAPINREAKQLSGSPKYKVCEHGVKLRLLRKL